MGVAALRRFVWRRAWPSVVASVLVAACVYVIASSTGSRYRAHALLSVSLTRSTSGNPVAADASLSLAQSYIHLAVTPQLLSEAAAAAHIGESATLLQHDVSVVAAPDSSFLTVTATQPTPARAVALAESEAELVAGSDELQQSKQIAQINAAISSTLDQLSALDPNSPQRSDLVSRYISLIHSTAAILQQPTNRITVVEPATATDAPKVSPRPKHDAAIALLLALFVNAILIVLLEVLTDRLPLRRTEAAIEAATSVPVLAEVTGSDVESFRAVRTALLLSRPNQGLKSIAVTGVEMGAGQVAQGLAIAFSAVGLTVLVDTDLRHPSVHTAFGLTRSPGTSELLLATAVREEAVRRVEDGNLFVVTAGATVNDPAGLLGERFRQRVLRATAGATVIVSTSGAAQYPDGVVSASACDVTVVVASRLGSRTRTLVRTVERLRQAGATPVGIIVVDRPRRTPRRSVAPAEQQQDEERPMRERTGERVPLKGVHGG